MQFLKTLLWVMLAVVIVLFAMSNWTPVSVRIGSQLRLDTTLAALTVTAFVAGFLPLYLFHRAQVWRLKRRISTLETRTAPVAPPPESARPAAPISSPPPSSSDPSPSTPSPSPPPAAPGAG